MNYYEHHIGDYAQATAHLSFIEDAAYSRLIRKYYAEEKNLPVDIKSVQRLVGARTKEEREAVANILDEFFTLEADGWHNKRCDAEIAKYQGKQVKARASAQARWDKRKPDAMRTHSESDANASSDNDADAMRTHSEGNAHQTPDTRHQAPDVNLTPPPGGEAAKPPMPKRAAQLAPDFYPNANGVAYAEQRRVGLAVELESFRNWHTAKGTTMKDWQAAWRTWCDKAVEFGGANGARASPARNESIHDKRARAMEELTGQRRTSNERNEIDITGEAIRVA
jgi:uncharacterized protein YdaU (DUF1376 family)